MSDDLVKRWDEYIESMGCVMGGVEHMAQQMRDRIEALERERVLDAKLLADTQALLEKAEVVMREAADRIQQLDREKREAALDALAAHGQANDAYEAQLKAEAKLAEVEKERDGLLTTWAESRERHLAAEATVASLKEQVEAMRGALEEIAGSDIQSFMLDANFGGYKLTDNRRYCDAPDVARLLKIARAALTKENSNG